MKNPLKFLAPILFSLIFCSCLGRESIVEPVSPPKLNIYQPSILNLEKGKAVETKDGIYTPQTDERWHSDQRMKRLELELYGR